MTEPVSSAFGPASVSLRLYPHNELPASEIVEELRRQARAGVAAGFDGVMVSEHHGGFWYLMKSEDIFAAEQDPATIAVRPSMLLPSFACERCRALEFLCLEEHGDAAHLQFTTAGLNRERNGVAFNGLS